jgi:hypothetical protein
MHRWIAATVTFVLAVGGLSLITTSESAQATCPNLRIAGTARGAGDGRVLDRFGVAVFLHQRTTPLARARAGSKGGYVMNFCKGDRVRTYAKRHHGYLNLDVIAHAWTRNGAGDFFVRTIRVPLRDSRVGVTAKLVRAYTRHETSGRMTAAAASAPAPGGSIIHPAIMRVEAVRHMQVNYQVSHVSIDSVGVHVGASDGGFSASGSMSISSASGFNRGGTMRVQPGKYERARLIKPALDVKAWYSCYNVAYWGGFASGDAIDCDVESSGDWTGDVTYEPDQHRGCWWSHNKRIRPWSAGTHWVGVSKGATFNATAQAGVLGNGVDVATTYDSATNYSYVFDRDKSRHFCVSGDKEYVAQSAQLYVSLLHLNTGGGCPSATEPNRRAQPKTCT